MGEQQKQADVFNGYRLEPVAAGRAERAQAAFRRVFVALAPSSMFDTEPQQLDKTLSRLAEGAEK